ncbi:MAG TPA: amidohydrolase family protein [Terriglobia bacterium]|nr:amidohydrolase family protein [Terriglobia bacterium]
MIRNMLCVVALMVAYAVLPARAQNTIAIRGGKLLTVTHGVIENGTVLVVNGKIKEVGAHVSIPPDAKVIDATGKVVMPGMIDAGDNLGLVEIPGEQITNDATEYNDPIHPELRVLDALNPRSELFRVTRAQGITNAVSTPAGGNLIAGQSAVISMDGGTVQQIVVESPAALVINLGESSKIIYGLKGKPPDTRMGQMAMLRQEFLSAQHYQAVLQAYARKQSEKKSGTETKDGEGSKNGGPPAKDLKLEALAAALDGKLPVVIHADRVSDIEMALRLADEFHLRIILADAAAAWRLADQLAEKKIPVIVGPILEEPSRMETLDVRLENAAILHRAGVPIAIQTATADEVRDMPFEVEYAIANGLPDDVALESVTLNPARFFGLDDRLGSLDAGKQANLVVLDGMPFHVKTHVVTELINGKVMDLSNRQTELYEFYKKKYGIE